MLEFMGNEFIPNCSPAILDEAVGERRIFYRLGESELFEYANKHTVINGSALVDVIPRMVVKDQGFIQIRPDQLDKNVRYELFESGRFKMTCKKTMLDMLEKGMVVMVYSEEYKLPTSIPYIAQSNGKNVNVIFVNVSDFLKMDQYGMFQVEVTRNYNALMAALLAACTAYRIITMASTLPADMADGMVLMYASMMERVINTMVHMDPLMREKIRYLSTEFALIQMYGTENGQRLFYRIRQTYFPKLTKVIMDTIDNTFKVDNFDKLSLFVDGLKEQYPSLKGLTTYMIYEKWIRTYGAATAMSIDYIGYHLYTICMVLMESPLINRMALEPVLEKNRGSDIFKRMQAIIG